MGGSSSSMQRALSRRWPTGQRLEVRPGAQCVAGTRRRSAGAARCASQYACAVLRGPGPGLRVLASASRRPARPQRPRHASRVAVDPPFALPFGENKHQRVTARTGHRTAISNHSAIRSHRLNRNRPRDESPVPSHEARIRIPQPCRGWTISRVISRDHSPHTPPQTAHITRDQHHASGASGPTFHIFHKHRNSTRGTLLRFVPGRREYCPGAPPPQ